MNIDDILPKSISLSQQEINQILKLHETGEHAEFNKQFLEKIFPGDWVNYEIDLTANVIDALYDKIQSGVRCCHSFASIILQDAGEVKEQHEAAEDLDAAQELNKFRNSDAANLMPTMSTDVVEAYAAYLDTIDEYNRGNIFKISTRGHEKGDSSDYFADHSVLSDFLLRQVEIKVDLNTNRAARVND